MERPLYAYDYADVPYDDAIELLATDPERLLQDATDRSAAHAEEVVGNLAVDLGGFELGRDVVIELDAFQPVEVLRGVLPLRWRAARGHLLFPTVDAQLEITALSLSPPRVQVALTGSYDPPFGVAGDLLDRAGPHRVAEAVVHRFVREVTARLELIAGGSDRSSRI
ncbi:MAG: hypothetical protein WD010_07330 [Nitriliruptor sp.]|uniref:hypothetical protein n=1 Tax=Nitriliruptor sp. TaxID=2448056 RepID=UPI0034A04A8E